MGEFFSTVETTTLVLLAIILAGPLIGAKLRVPGLLALIFLGMFLGPFGLGWLGRTQLVFDLGAIGILYLMFLAGLGFNLNAFNENRSSALGFGILSFVFPFVFSVVAGQSYFETGILASMLVGSMWASNTLVAYPDVRAAGLENTRAVRDAVSAGVVADVLSLLVLAVATAHVVMEAVDGEPVSRATPTMPLIISVPLLVGFTLWLLPRLGEWFFVRVGRSRVQRLLFALVGMAASAALAVAGGVAGIVGAFLAGIGLNRLVPSNSELMERIDFVGSSIFVPAFLVAIGLRIDPAAMIDRATILMGLVFLGILIAGKGLSVLVAARFFGYSFAEKGLIGSLSIGQAASTLAVGQIGLELGLFEQRVVNASILTIVLAALLTSFGTQFFIRRMPAMEVTEVSVGEKVLIDARSIGSDLDALVKFGGRIARGDDGVQVPFVVVPRDEKAAAREAVARAEAAALAAGYDTSGVVRLSDSFVEGTLTLADEQEASMLVLDWIGPRPGAGLFFGNELDFVGAELPVPSAAVHLVRPWDRVIAIPGNSAVRWHAEDARLALDLASRLCDRHRPRFLVIANDEHLVAEHISSKAGYGFVSASLPGDALVDTLEPTDLIVVPAYLLPEMPLHRRLRLSAHLADFNLAIVAGPGRLAVAPRSLPHAVERILGPHG